MAVEHELGHFKASPAQSPGSAEIITVLRVSLVDPSEPRHVHDQAVGDKFKLVCVHAMLWATEEGSCTDTGLQVWSGEG